MDMEFFEKLTVSDAETFLQNFLRESGGGFQEMAAELKRDNIEPDFSFASIPEVFLWLHGRLQTFPVEPDEDLPVWIRTSESYKKRLFEYDDLSKVLILRFAYYLGECFARASPKLRWATGDRETVEQNMPVVTGFKHNMELAAMMVAGNMFRRVLAGDGSVADVRRAVESWRSSMPS